MKLTVRDKGGWLTTPPTPRSGQAFLDREGDVWWQVNANTRLLVKEGGSILAVSTADGPLFAIFTPYREVLISEIIVEAKV